MARNKKRPPSSGGQPKIDKKLKEQVELRSHKLKQGVFGELPISAYRIGDGVLIGINYLCVSLSLAIYCLSKALDADFYTKAHKFIIGESNGAGADLDKELEP